jgi:hypothetical protein
MKTHLITAIHKLVAALDPTPDQLAAVVAAENQLAADVAADQTILTAIANDNAAVTAANTQLSNDTATQANTTGPAVDADEQALLAAVEAIVNPTT